MFCLSMFTRKRQTLTGCSRRYHLDESTFISRGFLGSSGVLFHFISFSGKNHISKQNSKARRHIRGYYVCLCPIKDYRLIWVNSNVMTIRVIGFN